MRIASSLALALSIAVLGCGGSNANTGPDADIVSYNCAADTRPQQYTVGLDNHGKNGLIDFKLMSADPAPPARGDNTWLVQLNAMTEGSDGSGGSAVAIDGAAIDGAALVVTPYMPDHQHGTPIMVGITDQGSGLYQLTPVNLWMPGYWETTIDVTSGSGSDAVKDSTIYKFCLSE